MSEMASDYENVGPSRHDKPFAAHALTASNNPFSSPIPRTTGVLAVSASFILFVPEGVKLLLQGAGVFGRTIYQ